MVPTLCQFHCHDGGVHYTGCHLSKSYTLLNAVLPLPDVHTFGCKCCFYVACASVTRAVHHSSEIVCRMWSLLLQRAQLHIWNLRFVDAHRIIIVSSLNKVFLLDGITCMCKYPNLIFGFADDLVGSNICGGKQHRHWHSVLPWQSVVEATSSDFWANSWWKKGRECAFEWVLVLLDVLFRQDL